MQRRSCIITAIALVILVAPLPGQDLTLDLRGTAVMPTTDFVDADLATGLGFGATIAYRLMPHLHLYGGWDWAHFTNSGPSFVGEDQDFEETGYTFGLRFEHPFGVASRAMYRLEAGGTYKHVEIEDADGELLVDTEHGLGYEAGAGVLLPLGSGNWRLAATVRYRSLNRDFTLDDLNREGNLRYLGLELGVARRF